MKFDFFHDPGHAWVKVPRKMLGELGIMDKITPYSYQRGEFVYLEEDCDAFTLHAALEAKGDPVGYRHRHANKSSKIRGYRSFSCLGQED